MAKKGNNSKSLSEAKSAKKDEFYTQMEDIVGVVSETIE